MLIDYHAHVDWDRKTNHYFIDEFLKDMDHNNIDIRVASALKGQNIKEQNMIIEFLVKKYPHKIIGSAVIDPTKQDCIDELKRIGESGLFKAIELNPLEHNYYPEDVDSLETIIELADYYGLIINFFTGWGPKTMPHQWALFAKKFPTVKFVALHMGTTDFGYSTIELVPKIDNMYVETSCMYELPILKKAFNKINPNKFLFGSHFPDKLTTNSIHTFDLLKLSSEIKDKLYFENAISILNLDIDKIKQKE